MSRYVWVQVGAMRLMLLTLEANSHPDLFFSKTPVDPLDPAVICGMAHSKIIKYINMKINKLYYFQNLK